MEKSLGNKFYEVEVRYYPRFDIATSNSFIYHADKKPQASVEQEGNAQVHRVYFDDPVEAEDYRQRVMADYRGGMAHEDLQ